MAVSKSEPKGRFANKIALITGGARGQGRAEAEALAREGADVVLIDSMKDVTGLSYPLATQSDMDATVALVQGYGRRALPLQVDVRDAPAVIAAVSRATTEFGKIDLLIANAGIYAGGALADFTDDMFDAVVRTNLYGVFNTFRAVLPAMIERGYGRIVATSSTAGRGGYAMASAYSASKWGVIGLVKSAAAEIVKRDITINAICPTMVNTPIINNPAAWRRMLPEDPNPTQAKYEAKMRSDPFTPQGVPWVEASDVADAALFLLSDEAKHITGTAVDVSAGGSASNIA